jgi:hypothetical protein
MFITVETMKTKKRERERERERERDFSSMTTHHGGIQFHQQIALKFCYPCTVC